MTLHDGEQSSQEWRSEQAASGGLQSRAPRGTRIAALFIVSLSSLLFRSSRPAVSIRHPHAARSSRHSPTTPFTSLKTKLITTAHSLSFNYAFFKISTQLRLNSCRKKDDNYTLG